MAGMQPQTPPFMQGMLFQMLPFLQVLPYMQNWMGSLLGLLAAFMPQPQNGGPNAPAGAGPFAPFPQPGPAGQGQPRNPWQESGPAGADSAGWGPPWGFHW